MSKTKSGYPVFVFLLLVSLVSLFGHSHVTHADEVNTSLGKVIIGLTKAEAMDKFGSPGLATENFWYYLEGGPFFVYFPGDAPGTMYLHPQFSRSAVGDTMEFKVFGYSADFTLRDITAEVEFIINRPEDFIKGKKGLFISLQPGEYQVLAKYKDTFSNPAYITVAKEEGAQEEGEKLSGIDILPYKPEIPPGNSIDFVALGTFIVYPEKRYVVRDISQKAKWFVDDGRMTSGLGDRRIYFVSAGTYNVFCRYKNMQSYSQEVSVRILSSPLAQTLKQITVIPEFITAGMNDRINIRALGTYFNNSIKDITNNVLWDVSDADVVTAEGSGDFLAHQRGVAEITAQLNKIKSLPVKLAVSVPEGEVRGLPMAGEGQGDDFSDTSGAGNENKDLAGPGGGGEGEGEGGGTGKPAVNIPKREKKLLKIKIVPDYLTIPLGQEELVRAVGIYSDNSHEDLTTLSEWRASDNKIASVYKGKISAISSGEAKITAEFKGKVSPPLTVNVEDAGLISIIVSPRESRISMENKLSLKAEGYFTDSSRKDITPLVSWKASNPKIVSVEKGSVRPLKIGKTEVYAEYLKVKSLPVSVRVVFTLWWFLCMIFKLLAFLLSLVILVFIILYFVTEEKKKRLESLINSNPRSFIINLYRQTRALLSVFGIKDDICKPPVAYALSVEKRYSIGNNIFCGFAFRFSEARYSQHSLSPDDAQAVLDEYRKFTDMIFASYGKFPLYLRLSLALIKRIPIF